MIGLTFFQLLMICFFCCVLGIACFFLCFLCFIFPYVKITEIEEEDYTDAE